MNHVMLSLLQSPASKGLFYFDRCCLLIRHEGTEDSLIRFPRSFLFENAFSLASACCAPRLTSYEM